jgi:hypothetical protein
MFADTEPDLGKPITSTPGPWKTYRENVGAVLDHGYGVFIGQYGPVIVHVLASTAVEQKIGEEVGWANACLVCAAPDLLDAAKQILYWYEGDSTEFNREMAIGAIRSAIDKAEGRVQLMDEEVARPSGIGISRFGVPTP